MKTAVQLARHYRQTTIAITAAALLSALGGGEARADTASADALFSDAKALMAQRRYTEACPKLAASHKLDPSGGTILHLALCHREEGRIATAYRELEEAVTFAQRDKREDREKAATALMAELAPKVPKLTILVSKEAMRIPGIEVKRDGVLVPSSEWGSPAWVDPGSHTVTAWAPGRKPFLTTLDLRADGSTAELSVPDLEADPTGQKPGDGGGSGMIAASSQGSDAGTGTWTGQRKAAVIIGGVGVAALGVGTVFGLQAAGAKSESDEHCKGNICDDEGIRIREDGMRAGTISTVAFIAGGVATVGGIVLFATGAPKQPKKASAGVTAVTVGPAWASVRGQW
jgi:hypothetical protein